MQSPKPLYVKKFETQLKFITDKFYFSNHYS